jgi:hypothetical protein
MKQTNEILKKILKNEKINELKDKFPEKFKKLDRINKVHLETILKTEQLKHELE